RWRGSYYLFSPECYKLINPAVNKSQLATIAIQVSLAQLISEPDDVALHLHDDLPDGTEFFQHVAFKCSANMMEVVDGVKYITDKMKSEEEEEGEDEGQRGPGFNLMVLEQTREGVQCPMQTGTFDAKMISKLGTWNVRTLCEGGKFAQLLYEFDNYNLDILGVSEMHWTGSGKIVSDGKSVLYSGHEEHHIHGVRLVLSKKASCALLGWKPVNDRIITARFQSRHAKTSIIQVYAPTEDSDDNQKDTFYGLLQDTIDEILTHDVKLLIGDFNAQITDVRRGLENVIGPHSSGRQTNDNGEQLLSFSNMNNFCIGNTYFRHKNIHKKTWRLPDGATYNEIDFICISRRWRSALLDVRAYRGADVGSDHYLLEGPAAVQQFQLELRNRFELLQDAGDIDEYWMALKQAVIEMVKETVGRQCGTQKERWIRDPTWSLIDERKIAKCRREQAKADPDKETTAERYRQLDRAVKQSCKSDKKAWFECKGAEAHEAASKNDNKTLYCIVRELTGAWSNSSAPIKNKDGMFLLTREEQDVRWVEHFKETLNQPTPANTYDFGATPPSPDLVVNLDLITIEETKVAIRTLKANKAPGLDEIAPETLKHGGDAIVNTLTVLLNKCWQDQSIPSDWGKGFLGKSSAACSEQIYMLCNIIEQCIEFQRPLLINFIDFKKASDSVQRGSLWKVLRAYGIPQRFVNVFQNLYISSSCCVRTDDCYTDFFNIKTGVKQGCILSSILFLLAVDYVMKKVMMSPVTGIPWTNGSHVTDLDFADDIALLANTKPALQSMTTCLEGKAEKVGLRIYTDKTKVMRVNRQTKVQITIGQQTVEDID
ncbi:hypothetical protein P4O66_020515, partial [Electrophorus voltai]